MAKKRDKTWKLSILLIKDSVTTFAGALKDASKLNKQSLKPATQYTGEFYYASVHKRSPTWEAFVAPVLDAKINGLFNASVSAVLFVRAKGRIFAITFGYGRNLLKPECCEVDFGLKAALNRIHHERVRSLDVRTHEDLVLTTRKQTSRNSEVGSFGLDVARDLLRAVTGEPSDPAFGTRITGADSLTINAAISAGGLGKKCEQVLDAYEDDEYKQHFEWIDHLNEVRDAIKIGKLNDKLIDALRKGKTEKLHFAPPEPIDWQNVDKFRMGGTRKTEYDDLDADAYLQALGGKQSEISFDRLKSYRVLVRWAGNDSYSNAWSVLNCVVWETSDAGELYALVDGRWFHIEKSFSNRVRNFVKAIPTPKKLLPNAHIGELEGPYNLRVAAADPDLFCLDCKLVKPTDAASEIEFCDLLSKQKQLIHIKRKTRSATLSHLFAQGTVSAREFLQDEEVRSQVRDHLKSDSTKTGFLGTLPNAKTRPNASEFEVVFGVIAKHNTDWPTSLPFFSQLNLMQNAKLLTGLGFNLALQQISEV